MSHRRDVRLTCAALSALIIHACAAEPPAEPPSTVQAALEGEPSVKILSPTNYTKLDGSKGAVSVDVEVAVLGATLGAEGYGLAVFVDGKKQPGLVDQQAFTVDGLDQGQHHVAVWLADPEGDLVEADAAIDGVYVRVHSDCKTVDDCYDGLSCSKDSFRTLPNGDVVWVSLGSKSDKMTLVRFRSPYNEVH